MHSHIHVNINLLQLIPSSEYTCVQLVQLDISKQIIWRVKQYADKLYLCTGTEAQLQRNWKKVVEKQTKSCKQKDTYRRNQDTNHHVAYTVCNTKIRQKIPSGQKNTKLSTRNHLCFTKYYLFVYCCISNMHEISQTQTYVHNLHIHNPSNNHINK